MTSFEARHNIIYWRGEPMSDRQVTSLLEHFSFAVRAEPHSKAARDLLIELEAAILAAGQARERAA